MADLLLGGYIRQIEDALYSQLVPQVIIHVCLQFYHSSLPLYYFSEMKYENPNGLYIADINHNQKWNVNIYNLYKPTQQTVADDLLIENSGICCGKNVKLPSNIKEQVIKAYKYYDYKLRPKQDVFNIIFRCTQSQTFGTIIRQKQFEDSNEDENMIGFDWELPSLREAMTHLLYSEKYGLLSIGCSTDTKIRHLCINDDNNMYWKHFNGLTIRNIGNGEKLMFSSSVLMENDTLLFNVGGCHGWDRYNYNASDAYLCNIDNKEWIKLKSMNTTKRNAGICYDDHSANKRMYVCGGDNIGSNKANYYDFVKNEWYDLPTMNNKHLNRPIIWKDDLNLLYISSVYSNGMEYIDTRINKKWKCLYGKYGFTLLQRKFNTKICNDHPYQTALFK